MILFFVLTIILVQGANAQISNETTKEPVIKSFQVGNGDIIDCIDIYKQIAFNHPLLKDHKIQTRPVGIPKGALAKSINTSSQAFLETVECPDQTVPVKRASKEDQELEKYLRHLVSNYSKSYFGITNPENLMHYHANVAYTAESHGARGRINIWSPQNVRRDQMSIAEISLMKGPPAGNKTVVGAGWVVDAQVFRDQRSRFFIYWTVDSGYTTGCFNTKCPGFVQVSSKIYLGAYFKPVSVYGGKQYDFGIQIYQDSFTGHWWVVYETTLVGYWPKALLPDLNGGPDFVSWGGYAASPSNEPSPAMGSGHFPYEKEKKAAYIRQIQVISVSRYIDPHEVQVSEHDPKCYNVQDGKGDEFWGFYIFYGGPGRCTQ